MLDEGGMSISEWNMDFISSRIVWLTTLCSFPFSWEKFMNGTMVIIGGQWT